MCGQPKISLKPPPQKKKHGISPECNKISPERKRRCKLLSLPHTWIWCQKKPELRSVQRAAITLGITTHHSMFFISCTKFSSSEFNTVSNNSRWSWLLNPVVYVICLLTCDWWLSDENNSSAYTHIVTLHGPHECTLTSHTSRYLPANEVQSKEHRQSE